jgi:hypothetical protein
VSSSKPSIHSPELAAQGIENPRVVDISSAIPCEAKNGPKMGLKGDGFRKHSGEQASIATRNDGRVAICQQGS